MNKEFDPSAINETTSQIGKLKKEWAPVAHIVSTIPEFTLDFLDGNQPQMLATPEVQGILNNFETRQLASSMPQRMEKTLNHIKQSIKNTIENAFGTEKSIAIAGPEWCREHPKEASVAHAHIIVDTYGDTYALPNKNPSENERALRSGNLDMFLLFDAHSQEPIGTACMLKDGDGRIELGRAVSKGHVGNKLIQDLRILMWLSDEQLASRFHTVFTTLRTAPDRDIGAPEPMRGGQAVSEIWSKIPDVRVGGFGPLYKKHFALEQFSWAFISRDASLPQSMWIADEEDGRFVLDWIENNNIGNHFDIEQTKPINPMKTEIHFAPKISGIRELVHGDIEFSEHGKPLNESIDSLVSEEVPFIQVAVSIEEDTVGIQKLLRDSGFQAFQFTPRLGDQPAQLWFGKINGDIPVVPTFWEGNTQKNPFWTGSLAAHAERIARNWKNQKG